jgi:hypothetical protein
MRIDRRNQTALVRKRRREFDRSVQKLRALGMPDWAMEYYRRAARVAGLPPHMVVCHVAVVAAGRQLQASIAQEQETERAAATKVTPGAPSKESLSYDGVQAMRRRVTTLWREIERHGTLLDAADGEASAHAGLQPEELSSSKLAEKLTLLRTQAANSEPAAPRSRRRRASPKGH